MEKEFLVKLGVAETVYGECKQLLDRNNPLAQDTLFPKFAGNICDLLGVEKADPTAYAGTFMKVFRTRCRFVREIEPAGECPVSQRGTLTCGRSKRSRGSPESSSIRMEKSALHSQPRSRLRLTASFR
jgi:hypothetical protein